jgi:hypothetical protein
MEGRSGAGPESDEAFDGAQGKQKDKKVLINSHGLIMYTL